MPDRHLPAKTRALKAFRLKKTTQDPIRARKVGPSRILCGRWNDDWVRGLVRGVDGFHWTVPKPSLNSTPNPILVRPPGRASGPRRASQTSEFHEVRYIWVHRRIIAIESEEQQLHEIRLRAAKGTEFSKVQCRCVILFPEVRSEGME